MKLWNVIFLFSLFCIVLLSACTNSNEVNTNSFSDIPEPTTQIESTDSGTSAPLEMTMALPSTGIFSTEISGNQDGAYYILPNTNDYSAQLLYYLYPGYDTAAILASTPFYSNETSKTGAFVSVDTLFEYDYQTASLKTRNLLTGEEKCFDCSPYAEQPDDEHRPDCRGPYGKYLLYETSYVSKEGYFLPHYRVLNLENGEFSEEMNLKDSQGNFLTSLTVVKDQFCVVYDYTSVNIAVADDNTMENVLIPKYALLSQDDYFHSRDNFHPISNDSF